MSRQERSKYHLHRYKARKAPTKYLTLIIDGMDNKKTHIPRARRQTKSCQSVIKLRTHLMGAIAHSGPSLHGKRAFCCFDLFQYPHDPNLTITVLLEVLKRFRENLPPTLYLQLDNCWKENKNKFVFAFLLLLVETRILDKASIWLVCTHKVILMQTRKQCIFFLDTWKLSASGSHPWGYWCPVWELLPSVEEDRCSYIWGCVVLFQPSRSHNDAWPRVLIK